MSQNRSKGKQIKFYVDEEELERLEVLSKARFMTVPQFCRLTSLQVKTQPARPLIIKSEEAAEEKEEQASVEKIEQVEIPVNQLSEKDLALLKELKSRIKVESNYFDYRGGFLKELYEFATRMEEIGNNGDAE